MAVRVDASAQIGTGHFMRCLTLADALKQRGAQIRFISRHLPMHLRDLLVKKGHAFVPLSSNPNELSADKLPHSHWLGTSQQSDAQDTIQALRDKKWDWLVVDHYALDATWERELRRNGCRILAIDDLADRLHDCDVLLDQNCYADINSRYVGKVPDRCRKLLGPRYALLREEFGTLRSHINPRTGRVERILIFFGGVDSGNYTERAIKVLTDCGVDVCVDVVIGAQHPRRKTIESECAKYGFTCYVQTTRMAELMASADLALGAGGASTWERCCLGLPTITWAVAENQRSSTLHLQRIGVCIEAADLVSNFERSCVDIAALIKDHKRIASCSRLGYELVDAEGTLRVVDGISNYLT